MVVVDGIAESTKATLKKKEEGGKGSGYRATPTTPEDHSAGMQKAQSDQSIVNPQKSKDFKFEGTSKAKVAMFASS